MTGSFVVRRRSHRIVAVLDASTLQAAGIDLATVEREWCGARVTRASEGESLVPCLRPSAVAPPRHVLPLASIDRGDEKAKTVLPSALRRRTFLGV